LQNYPPSCPPPYTDENKKQTILLIETRKQKGNEKDATLGPRPLKKTLSLMKKS